MRAKISALMDGELDGHELGEPMSALGEDADAFDAWRTYHLISDVLQGRAMLTNNCLRRVVARLAEEPVLVGPLPAEVARPRWFVPSALAASVAAVALVGWMAFAPQQNAPLLAPVASALQPTTVAAARPAPNAPTRLPMTAATRDYLIAHQVFSPRNTLQGMAPYVRSVSAESAPGKP